MIEQDVIHAKQIKALSFPLVALKFTNMGRVNRQACLCTAFKPANWAKKLSSNWITRYHWSLFKEYLALGHSLNFDSPNNLREVSGTELQLQTLEYIFASLGSQPKLRNSRNIFALLGSQPQLGNSRNIRFTGISTLTWKFSKYLLYPFRLKFFEIAGFTYYI